MNPRTEGRLLPETLAEAAVTVLETAGSRDKAVLGRRLAALWRDGTIASVGRAAPPDRPARPARPVLLPPRGVPRRRIGAAPAGRIALMHAIAHIELNAVDLAWDIVARFSGAGLPPAFFDDWVSVADDESRHHLLLLDWLAGMGAGYGDLPAHDGLWQAATATAGDLLARLAVVPLVLEARGLDVTPPMIAAMRRAGDDAGADILQVIHDDEIGHVAIGKRWFDRVAADRGLEPVATWQGLVRRHFVGGVKPPFNIPAREAAGFSAAFYGPLGEEWEAARRAAG